MRSRLPVLFVVFSTLLGCGAASEETAPVTGDEQNLTQSRITKNASASIEKLRADYDAAAKAQAESDKDGFFGYAAAFKWGSTHSLERGLSADQKSFLATELIQEIKDVPDRLPYGAELRALDVANASGVAGAELRIADAKAGDLDKVLGDVLRDGHLVVRIEPATPAPGATRTAGALMVVDMEKREALVLYGRRGPAPFRVDCTVSKMVSYQWEEALSKDEYPSVDAAEVPLFGDVLLDVGANGTLSNSDAKKDGDDYQVTLTRTGATVQIEAKSPTRLWAKLVVEGATGTIYGDDDGNGRANKAAELTCEVAR